ncbi:unnamed protein product, partial [Allacma fusca]
MHHFKSKMAETPGCAYLSQLLSDCASMVSSARELYDAAMQIRSELNTLMVSTVMIVMVISLLPAILRQIALWIAR